MKTIFLLGLAGFLLSLLIGLARQYELDDDIDDWLDDSDSNQYTW